MEQPMTGGDRRSREWVRVAALFAVVLATSAFVHPGVVIGVPLLLLLASRGFGNLVAASVAGMVLLIVAGGRGGTWDDLWYAERAWAVLLGGCFLALTLLVPGWRLTSRALGAAAGATAMAAVILTVLSGGWGSLDAAVGQSMQADLERTMQLFTALGGSAALSPDVLEVMRNLTAAQIAVFPALLGIESLAALSVAWWARARLLGDASQRLSPLRHFRFNDHLVWVLVLGLLLLVSQAGTALVRIGANTVVFMAALYALRGAAVFVFVSGGVSLVGYLVVAFLLVVVPPVVLGTAAVIGIGDTWLDLRARAGDQAA
jgi:hypothetical protein